MQTILQFWFGGVDDSTPIDKGQRPFSKWFRADKALDQEIRERFESDLNNALTGKYQDWEKSPQGSLALILLYDQFTRNMYRDTPKMYMADALAWKLALRLTSGQKEHTLYFVERVFVYMPLMHAEDVHAQRLSVRYFAELVEESKTKIPAIPIITIILWITRTGIARSLSVLAVSRIATKYWDGHRHRRKSNF